MDDSGGRGHPYHAVCIVLAPHKRGSKNLWLAEPLSPKNRAVQPLAETLANNRRQLAKFTEESVVAIGRVNTGEGDSRLKA